MTQHELKLPVYAEGATRKRNVLDVLETLPSKVAEGTTPKVLIRVDFNVPIQDGKITDDSRIRGALPTIAAVLDKKMHAILVSHMGRPKLVQKGADDDETKRQRKDLSLSQIVPRLEELLGRGKVIFGADCMGEAAKEAIDKLPSTVEGDHGSVVLLENLRFYKAEEKNEPEFTKTLASYCDGYINDAFGTSHRAHASVSGVPGLLSPEVCGLGALVASEVAYLDFSNKKPGEKVAAIIGGSKVSTKLPVIKGLLKSVDILVMGGGLAYTFAKAQGVGIGKSLCEDDLVDTAKELLAEAKEKGKVVVLPVDAVCTQDFPKGPTTLDTTKTFDVAPGSSGIDDAYMGLDVGPKTVALLKSNLEGANKIVFNGPMGVFEIPPFDQGTRGLVDVLEEVTKAGSLTLVGGGDSVAALEAFGKTKAVSYISTGGGATLELLAGDVLPGVAAIADFK